MSDAAGQVPTHADAGARPLPWWLPFLAFLAVGALTLWHLDGRLSREYSDGASAEAMRTEALLESAIGERVTLLNTLRALVASADDDAESDRRLRAFADQVIRSMTDVRRMYRLDADGAVRTSYPRSPEADLLAPNQLALAELASAIVRARDTRQAAVSGLVRLRPDTVGFFVYDPVLRDDQLAGYVAFEIGFAELLAHTLVERSAGGYAYRIADGSGRVLAISRAFPRRVSRFVERDVPVPGGGLWRIEIAIGSFQPALARATLWVVGGLLLGLVVFMVLRENARAERLASHSARLERLSRDLLDANVRLEERNRQVSEANQAKSRFLANVSHELRTPINAIVGYNSLTLGGIYGELAAQQRAALERIDAAAKHLLGLVDDVLGLSEIETGRVHVTPEPVRLDALAEDVVRVVMPSAAAKGLRLRLEVDAAPTVITDPRIARQIVLNLAANAIKYTREGHVTLSVASLDAERAPDGQRVAITISDSGIGISPDDLHRIFDEFEQVRPEGRGDSIARGAGLGLTVAGRLARLLGGEVRAESEMGVGSRFSLLLPMATPPRRSLGATGEGPAVGENASPAAGRDGAGVEG